MALGAQTAGGATRDLAALEGVCRYTALAHQAALRPAPHLTLLPTVAPVAAVTAVPEGGPKGQELGCEERGQGLGGLVGGG